MTDDLKAAPASVLVERIAQVLTSRRQMLATAESCTGGMIAAACTDISGSSEWFECGVVSYSNRAKSDLLEVPADLIEQHGAVSEPVALAMADGMRRRSGVDWAVAVTGVAGPTGGSPDKPVGTVWMAWAQANGCVAEHRRFTGDRADVRRATVQYALAGLLARLQAP
ncbi:MAG: CinA family protein [Burkholderiaceae bacterium]